MSLGCIASPGRAGVFWGFFHVSIFLNLPRKAKKSLGNGEKTSLYKEIYCILKYYIIIFIYAGHVAGVFCAQHTLTEALGNLQVFSLAGVLIEMLCGADKWGPLSLWRRTWFRVWKPKETVFLSKFSLDEFACISSHSYCCLLLKLCDHLQVHLDDPSIRGFLFRPTMLRLFRMFGWLPQTPLNMFLGNSTSSET